jgi:hypothetical protein
MDDDDDINGVGLLSGPPPDPEQVKRAEAAEALRRQQEAAAARREAEIQETCDQIDAFMSPLLKAELELENAKARVSRQPRRFLRGSGPAVQAGACRHCPHRRKPSPCFSRIKTASWLTSKSLPSTSRLSIARSVLMTPARTS